MSLEVYLTTKFAVGTFLRSALVKGPVEWTMPRNQPCTTFESQPTRTVLPTKFCLSLSVASVGQSFSIFQPAGAVAFPMYVATVSAVSSSSSDESSPPE